jgi:hypothetical protein
MRAILRNVALATTVFALFWQTGCSSDDGDDGDDGGGGTSGSGNEMCEPECTDGMICTQCMNPENPDEPFYACISEGVSC